ncbi:MAG: hypothetical protein ACK4P3_08290, partial [Fimbriimonadaceae bacterium]
VVSDNPQETSRRALGEWGRQNLPSQAPERTGPHFEQVKIEGPNDRFFQQGSVFLDGATSVAGGFSGNFAQWQGRRFESINYGIGVRIDNSVSLWYQGSRAYARGRTAGTRFHARSSVFGAKFEFAVTPQTRGEVSISQMQAGGGRSVTPTSAAGFSGPTVTVVGAGYRFQMGSDARIDSPEIDEFAVYRIRGGYSTLRAFQRSARIWEVGADASWPLATNLYGNLSGTFYFESSTGLIASAANTVKSNFSASVIYRPLPYLTVFGALDFMPSGAPYTSTGFGGLNSFLIYEPPGALSGVRKDAIASFSFGVQLGTKF